MLKSFSFSLAVLALLAVPAFAQPNIQNLTSQNLGNQISFQVFASRDVANNEATARLVKNATAKTAKQLADKITPTINQSLAIAKKYPSVTVSTGSQTAYPTYDKNAITGFSGSAALVLKSQDSEAMSALIAELQPLLVVESLNFSVSPTLYQSTKNSLMTEAVSQFQTQASLIAHAWGATSYNLVEAQMNDDWDDSRHFAMPVLLSASMAEPMTTKAGDTTITYKIKGTIELIK